MEELDMLRYINDETCIFLRKLQFTIYFPTLTFQKIVLYLRINDPINSL